MNNCPMQLALLLDGKPMMNSPAFHAFWLLVFLKSLV